MTPEVQSVIDAALEWYTFPGPYHEHEKPMLSAIKAYKQVRVGCCDKCKKEKKA